MSAVNVFVIGLDEANLEQLRAVPEAERYRFHPLLSIEELQRGAIPIVDLMTKAREQLAAFEGRVDAIVGFWDFPVSSMVPMLCAEFGTSCASLRAVVTCEHKYWSRLEQGKAINEVPRFALVDLDGEPVKPGGLDYPMWLKPVKGFSSELAFRVEDDEQFERAFAAVREGVDRVGEPFEYVLDQLELPPEVAGAGGRACLAEEVLRGNQVATEGYVYRGEAHVYGVLDSINYPGRDSFLRHQYPSRLPEETTERLAEISRRVIRQVGLDNATFSVEFFHDPDGGGIGLLEINPRHSQSHAELFDHVDGVPNHHVMLKLALGEDPAFSLRRGRYRVAAKCYARRFSDGTVRRMPTGEEVARIERDLSGVTIHLVPAEGARLSEMDAQDSYSYELAEIVVGADSVDELEDKYAKAVDRLRFEIDDIDAVEQTD